MYDSHILDYFVKTMKMVGRYSPQFPLIAVSKNEKFPLTEKISSIEYLVIVGRKFTKFDDDLHEYMAQDERESKYSDEIFDSDEDSDGFEPKSKSKSRKKKSNKRSFE